MKKLAIITTGVLAVALVVSADITATNTYGGTFHNMMGVTTSCNATYSNCGHDPETGAPTGSITTITGGTEQDCVSYPDSDCPKYDCYGGTQSTTPCT